MRTRIHRKRQGFPLAPASFPKNLSPPPTIAWGNALYRAHRVGKALYATALPSLPLSDLNRLNRTVSPLLSHFSLLTSHSPLLTQPAWHSAATTGPFIRISRRWRQMGAPGGHALPVPAIRRHRRLLPPLPGHPIPAQGIALGPETQMNPRLPNEAPT